jgi:hypothetical protein
VPVNNSMNVRVLVVPVSSSKLDHKQNSHKGGHNQRDGMSEAHRCGYKEGHDNGPGIRKPLKGEHGEKPSEIYQKSHIVDCELVVAALTKMPGPIPGRQYIAIFADLAEVLQQVDNWRWLKDAQEPTSQEERSWCE